ncbi:SsrA-binding protein [Candidatus Mycoplasma haematolamae str. Purdue]|uniref:SsrA-binding protein n=1 Tax=Mycoplasma haematolamae (strain Purdue) TaxID=1212765 RepID=I7CKQ4_MYCHA|nr:SsrA-binding protein [Candidatus Mycoplasma haematolamae str. Purdue]
MHKREIRRIAEVVKKENYVILPSQLFLQNRRIKVELLLCKYDKTLAVDKSERKYKRSEHKRKFSVA